MRVYKGKATVRLATLSADVPSRQQMHINIRCGDMIPSLDFDVAAIDALDQWSRWREEPEGRF